MGRETLVTIIGEKQDTHGHQHRHPLLHRVLIVYPLIFLPGHPRVFARARFNVFFPASSSAPVFIYFHDVEQGQPGEQVGFFQHLRRKRSFLFPGCAPGWRELYRFFKRSLLF